MRRRNEWHAPTASLLSWADKLGVEVPAGISARELYGILRTTETRRIQTKLKELNLQPGMRFRRKNDGVTYTIQDRLIAGPKLGAYNEKLRRRVEISFTSFLEFYELID